ncbi:MAG: class I SAM-dependent methyltransferase [Blastocatellia bacterium]|nr:class I SAM-dependent methyltransferase [Blastocatellia bacterium]
MTTSSEKIRADFDQIACLTENQSVHPLLYEDFLLQHLPRPCGRALDIGCGQGFLAGLLARQAAQVLAVDLSSQMIRIAQNHHQTQTNLTFWCGDFFQLPLETAAFDCVVSAATLHHLDLEPAVSRMKTLLKPGGTLLIQDLRSAETWYDRLEFPVAAGVSLFNRWWKTGRFREPAAVRAAWNEHGRTERYLSMSEVAAMCHTHLPGAQWIRHVRWRYTVVWEKPAT